MDEFWNAALALEVGEVSPVVETQYGFHVLRLEDRVSIPFEEARGTVALDVAEMLGIRQGEVAPVPAPEGLRTLPEEELSARLLDPSVPDSAQVAGWSGGMVSMGAMRDRVATLGRTAYEALLDPARAPSLGEEATMAARWRAAADQARVRGFSVSEAFESSLELEWVNQAQLWATSLGFREGMGAEAVKAAALEALGTTAQNATLARAELLERSPLLERDYHFPPEETAGDG